MSLIEDLKTGKLKLNYFESELIEAFEDNFDLTVENLSNYNYPLNISRYDESKEDSKKLIDLFNKHGVFSNTKLLKKVALTSKFAFDAIVDYTRSLPISFKRYIAKGYIVDAYSVKKFLEFDFDNTLDTLREYSSLYKSDLFSSDLKDIENIFDKRGIFENLDLLKKVGEVNIAFAAMIVRRTGRVINMEKLIDNLNTPELGFKFLDELKKDGTEITEIGLKEFTKNIYSRAINYSRHYEELKSGIEKYGIPTDYIPLASIRDLSRLHEDKIISDQEYEAFNLLKKRTLENDVERRVLDLLGYKEYSCVEDAIISKKNDLYSTLNDKLLLKLYGLKFANKNGIFKYKIDTFKGDGGNCNGSCTNGYNLIEIYNWKIDNFNDAIHIMHHEIIHAVQYKNSKEINIEEDNDLLEYAKDDILRKMCGEDFYNENIYYQASYEFDADFKAKLETDKLFGDILETDYKKFIDNEEYFLNLNNEILYDRDFKRGEISLSESFDKCIGIYMSSSEYGSREEKLKHIKNNHPILIYEYDFSLETPKKRTNKELVDLLIKSEGKDRKIYKSIITSRCNKYKSGEESEKNLKEIKELLKEFNKEGYLKEIIENNKNIYKKYEEYLERLLVHKNGIDISDNLRIVR